eukprot:220425-Rhodomonas_salina.3
MSEMRCNTERHVDARGVNDSEGKGKSERAREWTRPTGAYGNAIAVCVCGAQCSYEIGNAPHDECACHGMLSAHPGGERRPNWARTPPATPGHVTIRHVTGHVTLPPGGGIVSGV